MHCSEGWNRAEQQFLGYLAGFWSGYHPGGLQTVAFEATLLMVLIGLRLFYENTGLTGEKFSHFRFTKTGARLAWWQV
ncbi:MAG: hypothetical protein PW792_11455 [Acidobacteriaceae bacterium]|nr:hypothetical protein [Acidobacteriaceae bacterium]